MFYEKLVKSPMNYVGGKFKLLPQLLPLFPNDIDTFVDLMGGGFNVGANVKSNRVIYNELDTNVVEIINMFNIMESENIIDEIYKYIFKYKLSDTCNYGYEFYSCNSSSGVAKYNKDKYFKMRDDYNKSDKRDVVLLYTLIIFAFNNQIRFNSKGDFNMPVNKRDFNGNVQKNIKLFCDRLKELDLELFNLDFRDFDYSKLTTNDFVYIDPPYLLGCASYNEQDGWNLKCEQDLLDICDMLTENNIKFGLSNVLVHKGKSNDLLIEWSNKYNVSFIDKNYNNCNYHSLVKENDKTVEVFITNY